MIGLAILLGLTATPAPVTQSTVPPAALMQQLRVQCRDAEAVLPAMAKGLEAQKAKDWATAKASYEQVISNCRASRASDPARVLRAEIAWRDKDYGNVIGWLQGVQRVRPHRLNLMASFLAMSADKQIGEAAAFASERSMVTSGVEAALSSEGRRLGDFTVDGDAVVAYDVHLTQGAFARLLIFAISPKDPMALPQTVMLTDDLKSHQIAKEMGSPAPYFLDGYSCLRHVTIKLLPGHDGQPPTYDEVKPLVIDYLKTHSWVTGLDEPSDLACAWPQYVAPGVGD